MVCRVCHLFLVSHCGVMLKLLDSWYYIVLFHMVRQWLKMWTWKTRLIKQLVTVSKTRLHPSEQQLKLLKNIWSSGSLFQVFYFKMGDYEITRAIKIKRRKKNVCVLKLRNVQLILFTFCAISEALLMLYWLLAETSTWWCQGKVKLVWTEANYGPQ